jgi:hypothetical protein
MFERAPGRDQIFGSHADLLRNGQQIGLVRLQESKQRAEQDRLVGPGAQLICPNSGQVQEPQRAPFVTKRRRKRRKCKRMGVGWRSGKHGLEPVR